MKVDEKATEEARRRHAEGVQAMTELFDVSETMVRLLVPQDQRWLSTSKFVRRVYRRARNKTDPEWASRRRRRKRQRAARKRNR